MNKEEPKVLTRMRLSCCWGDNLNEKELNEVVDYINLLQQKVNQLEEENKQFQQANVEFVSQNNKLQHRIYEAIEYIKHSWWLRTDQTYDTSKDLKGWEAEELLSILERGKE